LHKQWLAKHGRTLGDGLGYIALSDPEFAVPGKALATGKRPKAASKKRTKG
jgi:hypothetical protein